MRRNRASSRQLLTLLGACVFAASCSNDVSSDSPPEPSSKSRSAASGQVSTGAVPVQLVEFRIEIDAMTVQTGDVTFAVRNEGDYAHEFKVIKLHPGTTRLPTAPDGSIDERGKGIDVIEAIAARDLGPGYSSDLMVTLEPGDYVLACNVVIDGPLGHSHYQLGMSTILEVR
jgi:uncharacterized cupredoxin-like copper-binding protein